MVELHRKEEQLHCLEQLQQHRLDQVSKVESEQAHWLLHPKQVEDLLLDRLRSLEELPLCLDQERVVLYQEDYKLDFQEAWLEHYHLAWEECLELLLMTLITLI